MIALSGCSQFVADRCQEALLHRQGGLGPDPGGRIVLGKVSQFSGPSLQQMLGVLEIRDVLLESRLGVPQRPLLPCDDRHEHKPDQRRQDHGCRVDRNILPPECQGLAAGEPHLDADREACHGTPFDHLSWRRHRSRTCQKILCAGCVGSPLVLVLDGLTDIPLSVGRPGDDCTVRRRQSGGAPHSQIGLSQYFPQVQGLDHGGDHAGEVTTVILQLSGNGKEPSAALAIFDGPADDHPVGQSFGVSLEVVAVTQVQRVGRRAVLVKQHLTRLTDQHISSDQWDTGNGGPHQSLHDTKAVLGDSAAPNHRNCFQGRRNVVEVVGDAFGKHVGEVSGPVPCPSVRFTVLLVDLPADGDIIQAQEQAGQPPDPLPPEPPGQATPAGPRSRVHGGADG